jgi:multiple sugar transport system permease protein
VRRERGRLRDGLVLVGLAAYALPFFWQALTSLKPEAELMVLPPLLPSRLTLEHYRVVLERSVMVRAMVNSLGVGAITTVLALTLGLGAAYAFARFAVPGKRFLLLLIVAGTAFPQIATVSPLFLIMRALELRDTWLGLILANA